MPKTAENSLGLNTLENISAYDYYVFYLRNSRLIGLAWLILSACFTLLVALALFSPSWIGDSLQSPNRGYFGLYSYCVREPLGAYYTCSSLPSDWPRASTSAFALVGAACLLSAVMLAMVVLCLVFKCERVFHLCAWIQLVVSK